MPQRIIAAAFFLSPQPSPWIITRCSLAALQSRLSWTFQQPNRSQGDSVKITNVRAYVVEPNLPEYGSSSDRQWTFIRVDTDEGLTGWGEATNYPRGGSFIVASAVRQFRDALIGEDASDIERIWHKIFRFYTYLGNRGLVTTAISGIDIALWDIKGQALGRPVYDLLGGKVRDDIRLYANGWFGGCSTPEQYAAAAAKVVKSGHTAMKMDPFLEMRPYHTGYVTGQISADGEEFGYDITKAIREAVGPDIEILIDAHGHYNVPTAIRIANTLFEQSQIGWFEEPLPPEGYDALKTVRDHVEPAICVGERLFTRWDFVRIFKEQLADYVMPDIVWTGGISEIKKIATMAEAYYVPISPHNAMGPLQVVAGAHAMMSVPNFYRLEHSIAAIPSYNAMLTESIDFHGDSVSVSDRPGLGTAISEEAIAKFAHPGWPVE
jgi:galactonate dehydratase